MVRGLGGSTTLGDLSPISQSNLGKVTADGGRERLAAGSERLGGLEFPVPSPFRRALGLNVHPVCWSASSSGRVRCHGGRGGS